MKTDRLTTVDDVLAGQANESRVWIDGELLQDGGITALLSTDEPATPSLRNMSVSVPGRHGAYDFGGYLGERVFKLDVVFPRQSYSDLKRQIRAFNRRFFDVYGRPKTVSLRFGDEVDKYYNVRLTSAIPIDRSAERGYASIQLTAYDPYAYSTVNANDVTWGSEVVTFEWSYLLGMGGTAGGERITRAQTIPIYVDGESLRPVIEINGRANGLTISANGQSFKLPNFTATKWTIDGDRYVVLRNGVEDLGAMTGDFIELLHGDNDVEISGSALDFDLTIKYRDRYV